MSATDSSSFIAEGESTVEEAPEQEPQQTEAAEPQGDQRQPLTPVGRRGRAKAAQDELRETLRSLQETITRQGETYAQKLERIERENAELRGQFQGYMSRPPQQERREEQPDPDALYREANKLLDNKDFDGYQRKYAQAVKAEMMREIAPRFQQQQAPQIHPMLQSIAGQYADVMSDADAFDIAQTKDRALARRGIPEGPQRWQLAFEEGRRALNAGKKTPQQFSQGSRSVLSGVPTQRNASQGGNGDGTKGVRLTPHEMATARKFKMSNDEYAAHLAELHPERVENE